VHPSAFGHCLAAEAVVRAVRGETMAGGIAAACPVVDEASRHEAEVDGARGRRG
jgi:hypothetical protein